MATTRTQIVLRGLTNRCPNCGRTGLFVRAFTLHRTCPCCGLELERGEGFFLGSMSVNYGITVVGVLVPVLVLWLAGGVNGAWAAGLAVAGTILFPVAFYRSSRSWWLMAFFFFLPQDLPSNDRVAAPGQDADR